MFISDGIYFKYFQSAFSWFHGYGIHRMEGQLDMKLSEISMVTVKYIGNTSAVCGQ
jgi:hypothetical protein